jgi:hypothetical protein
MSEMQKTKKELIKILRDFESQKGSRPSARDCNFETGFGIPYRIFMEQFGSWKNALKAAGIDITQHMKSGKQITFENYKRPHVVQEAINQYHDVRYYL